MSGLEDGIETLRTRSPALASLTLVGDDSLEGTACRVQWADGAADREPAKLEAEIDAAVQRFLDLVDDLPEFQGETSVEDTGPEDDGSGIAAAVENIDARAKSGEPPKPAADAPAPATETSDAQEPGEPVPAAEAVDLEEPGEPAPAAEAAEAEESEAIEAGEPKADADDESESPAGEPGGGGDSEESR